MQRTLAPQRQVAAPFTAAQQVRRHCAGGPHAAVRRRPEPASCRCPPRLPSDTPNPVPLLQQRGAKRCFTPVRAVAAVESPSAAGAKVGGRSRQQGSGAVDRRAPAALSATAAVQQARAGRARQLMGALRAMKTSHSETM